VRQDPQCHVRVVQSRWSVRVLRWRSNQTRSSERKAPIPARGADCWRNQDPSRKAKGSRENPGVIAASTGIRQSELFALKWGDINLSAGTMNVARSIVHGFVGPCKTESSQKPVPIHPRVCEALAKWKEQSSYQLPEDWVFASRHSHGEQPYCEQAILHKYLRPAARELGIETRFGWHTFRDTYSTLLRSVGTEFKVMQELLRHSTIRSTLDVYTQAITPAKQNAQAAVMFSVNA
jgi:integrase